jgi:hypothetical protein
MSKDDDERSGSSEEQKWRLRVNRPAREIYSREVDVIRPKERQVSVLHVSWGGFTKVIRGVNSSSQRLIGGVGEPVKERCKAGVNVWFCFAVGEDFSWRVTAFSRALVVSMLGEG